MKCTSKIVSLCLVFCLLVTAIPISGFATVVEEPLYPASYKIYPNPHEVVYGPDGILLDSIKLVISENADAATKSRILEALQNSQIGFEVSDVVVPGAKNVVLAVGSSDPVLQGNTLEGDISALEKLSGYVLNISPAGIQIVGRDATALFYGVTTLKQILTFGNNVRSLRINDYADNINRSVIEGFYGIPWSFEARKSIIELSGQYKMNQYVYAPKDDPYHHGDQWREPYPEEEAAKIKQLVDVAKANNVDFVWAIHVGETMDFSDADDAENLQLFAEGKIADPGQKSPGLGRQWEQNRTDNHRGLYIPPRQCEIDKYEAEETFQSVLKKFDQLYSLGVRQFGFFADDIDFPHARYGVIYVVPFINRINEEFVKGKGDVKPLLFCPTYYYQSDIAYNGTKYMGEIKKLDPSIEIMYTGASVMSNVNNTVTNYFTNTIAMGRNPYMWFNYPVNDYQYSNIFLGPVPGLNANAVNTTGIGSNPMQQGFASEFALFGVADYNWNRVAFNRLTNWRDSYDYIVPEVAESMHEISKHSMTGYSTGSLESNNALESAELNTFMAAFTSAVTSGENVAETGAALKAEFDKILTAIRDVRENCELEGLLKDIDPWLLKLESLCRTGQYLVDFTLAEGRGDAWTTFTASFNEVSKWNHILADDRDGSRTVAEIGSYRLKPFITGRMEKAEAEIESKFSDKDPLTAKAEVFTNIPEYKTLSVVKNGIDYVLKTNEAAVVLKKDRFIGVKLDNMYYAKDVQISATPAIADLADVVVEYSINGVEWTALTEGNELAGKTIRYLRLVNRGTESVSMNLSAFKVSIDGQAKAVAVSAVTTAPIYSGNYVTNLVDGHLPTSYWTSRGQTPGETVTITYDREFTLNDLELYEATGDYIRDGAIYVSTDGEEYTKICSVGTNFEPVKIDNMDYYVIRERLEEPMRVKYIKIVTESAAGSWTKLHEFRVNVVFDPEGGMVKPFNDIKGGTPSNLFNSVNQYFSTNSDEGFLNYTLSENANAAQMDILQNAANLSNAKMSIRTSLGWQEIGALTESYNSFDLSIYPDILEVRFDWLDNGIEPKIHLLYTITDINKTELSAALEQAKALGAAVETEPLRSLILAGEAIMDNDYVTRGQIDDIISKLQKALTITISAIAAPNKVDVTIQNNTEDTKNAILILAVYGEDGRQAYTSNKIVTVVPGKTVGAFELETGNFAGCAYKVFLWDAVTMIPICEAAAGVLTE